MADIYWPFDTSRVSEWCGSVRGTDSHGNPIIHMGTDFAVPHGSELRATVTGIIKRWNNDGLGAYVLDIIRDDGLLVRNAHLSRMDVNTGDRVQAGQVIGLTGGTPGTPGAGYSTGAHLHWELRWDRQWNGGNWVDPRPMNPAMFGETPTPQPPRRPTMATMFYVQRDGKTTFALAGDGAGKAAWLETEQQDFANKLASIHGSALQLSPDTWDQWRNFYLGGN